MKNIKLLIGIFFLLTGIVTGETYDLRYLAEEKVYHRSSVEHFYVNNVYYGKFTRSEDGIFAGGENVNINERVVYESVSGRNDYLGDRQYESSIGELYFLNPDYKVGLNQYWANEKELNLDLSHYNSQFSSISIPVKRVFRINENPDYRDTDYMEIYEYIIVDLDNIKSPWLMEKSLKSLKYNVVNRYKWDFKNARVADFSGKYELNMDDLKKNIYHVEGESDGRIPEYAAMENYNLLDEKFGQGNNSFMKFSRGKDGVTVSMDSVMFEPESAVLLPEFREKLKSLGETLNKTEGDLYIYGYCADVGSEIAIKRLSQERADAVGSYLGSCGVNRIKCSEGRGSENPIGDNNTREGRTLNRRVELVIR